MLVIRIPFPDSTGGGGGTPPTFVGSQQANGANASSITISLANLVDETGATVTLQQNDYVCLAVEVGSSLDLTFGETSGTWAKECDLLGPDTSKCNFAVFTKKMGATPDTSVTINGFSSASNYSISAVVHAFRGVNTGTPHDVAVVTATGTNTGQPNPPAITPVTSGALIYVAAGASTGASSGAAFTNPGDLDTTTNRFRTQFRSSVGDGSVVGAGMKAWGGSGAFDPAQWGGNRTSTSCAWCACCIALRPA